MELLLSVEPHSRDKTKLVMSVQASGVRGEASVAETNRDGDRRREAAAPTAAEDDDYTLRTSAASSRK